MMQGSGTKTFLDFWIFSIEDNFSYIEVYTS